MKAPLPPLGAVPHLPGHFLVREPNLEKQWLQEQWRESVPRVQVPNLTGLQTPRSQTPRGQTPRQNQACNQTPRGRADLPPLESRSAGKEDDRSVLRFSVCERKESSMHMLLFYLKDNTLEISKDSRSKTSRRFLHRCVVPHPNGDSYTPESLTVGDEVSIYGHQFTIINCDAFTRQWYESQGILQPEATEEEVTSPHSARSLSSRGNRCDKLGQYIGNYRDVCRFYATYDDMIVPNFERRDFVVYYYLEDDTIKISENCMRNAGRDKNVGFYRRSRMLKSKQQNAPGVFSPTKPQKSDYVQLHDFAVGQTISLVCKDFMIYDADRWTRFYFLEHFGVTLLPKISMDVKKKSARVVPLSLESRTTSLQFGEGTCLLPVRNGDLDQVLKFKLMRDGDEYRCFLLTHYLPDQSQSITEIDLVAGASSGARTGPYLTKAAHINQLTNAPLHPKDLYPVGSLVKILGRTFRTIEIGERTKAYFLNGEQIAPLKINISKLFEQVDHRMQSCRVTPRDLFRQLDCDKKGALCKSKIRQLLRWCHYPNVPEHELLTIMHALDANSDGVVTYSDFCSAMNRDGGLGANERKCDENDTNKYGKLVMSQEEWAQKAYAIRRVLLEVGELLHSRPWMEKRLMVEFNEIGLRDKPRAIKRVDANSIHEVLERVGYPQSLDDIHLLLEHFNAEGKDLDYISILRMLKASYHDLALP